MNTPNTSTNTQTSPDASQMIRKDIKAKWDKFSDRELTSLKDVFEKVQAQRDVDALLKGRELRQA
jgi:hypothetical protein